MEFGINIDEMQKKLNHLKTGNKVVSKIWKPKGSCRIRIVPYVKNLQNPFCELKFHWGIGNKSHLSPTSYGNPDPIKEFADELSRRSRETGSKEDWQLSRKLNPKLRVFVPVIVRDEEDKGVMWWGFGKTIYQELLSIIMDEDYGDITDPVKGFDLKVEHKSPQEAGNQYGSTTIRVSPRPSKLTENPVQLKDWMSNQPSLEEIYPEPSYSELENILRSYLEPDDQTNEEVEDEIDSYNESNDGPGSTETDSILDEFEDLLNG